MADKASQIEIDGRPLRVTNLDKVMYPATGTTKGDVIGYYAAVAPWFVPHAAQRPATRKRWVHGVDGPAFFTKNLDSGTPSWIKTASIEHSSDTLRYPLVDDAATLVFLAQLAALEIHVPQWRFDTALHPQHPDRLVLDLDPGEGAGLDECVEVALLVKEILDGVGMTSVPVTSGSKGIHLYAGLDGHLSSTEASEFARQLAVALEAAYPNLVVSDMKKALRGGKVFFDWSQNNGSKTTVAPYSMRGRQHPYVAAPRTWDEIAPGLAQLTYVEVLERLHSIGDPLAVLLPARSLTRVMGENGDKTAETSVETRGWPDPPAKPDRLSTYRAKRDAAKTPEPVPTAAPDPASSPGNTFVIQQHQARRLHHDLRLEHEGVLVSWAIPKLTPLDGRDNRLAVQTEDHPLEYATFEGTIPRGEYGAGEMVIWDAGTYECEKWRDGLEVIATLHGRPDGGLGGVPRRYALIHTGSSGDNQWLIHLMHAASGSEDASTAAPAAAPAGIAPTVAPAGIAPAISVSTTGTTFSLADLPPVEPMLATGSSPAELRGDDWHFEVKWDGYRAIASVAGGELRLSSRRGNNFTADYPELTELVGLLGDHAAVLDGEIVALGPDGRSHFDLLANRASGSAAHYMAFDLLWLDGTWVGDRPYVQRRAALEALLGTGGALCHVPETFGTDREFALDASASLQLEGLIAKRPNSTYAPGRRSRTWLKLKNVHHQDAIVVGWKRGEGGRAHTIGAMLLAVTGPDGLVYVGRVGTGLTDRALADAEARLAPLARPTPPLDGVPRPDARGVTWVEPTLVADVEYANYSAAGHLRFPVWRGWRDDKSPAEAVRD